MKTSYIKQTKIETSLEHDITMSTPVMNGRTLQLPISNENPFNSPAFTLTPKINLSQMGKNEEMTNALQSLKDLMGIHGNKGNSNNKKSEINEKSKCDLVVENNKSFGLINEKNPTYSEFLRKRILPEENPQQNATFLPYHNKIVKAKAFSNSASTNNLQKLEANDFKPKFEESKSNFMNETKNLPTKEEGKVSNIKSKLKQFEI